MNNCSLQGVCMDKNYTSGCKECDIAKALAEAEKPAATYVTASLTDEQLDMLAQNKDIVIKEYYSLFPNNAFIWFWIALAVVFVVEIIYGH